VPAHTSSADRRAHSGSNIEIGIGLDSEEQIELVDPAIRVWSDVELNFLALMRLRRRRTRM
jgi:hypothetical protein